MESNTILTQIMLGIALCIIVIVIVTIRYLCVLWIEIKKARLHFQQLEPKINALSTDIATIEKQVNEIENTPLIQRHLTVQRYGKIAANVIKNQSKYRLRKMKKQEKQLKKRLKHLRKQAKMYKKR